MSSKKRSHVSIEDNDNNNDNNEIPSYEQIRLENIKRNQDFLSTLGLDSNLINMNNKSSNVPTKRGVTTNKSKAKFVLPTRRSGRVTIEKIKSEIELLKNNGDNDELIKLKEIELNDLLANKPSNEIVVDNNQSYSDVLVRLVDHELSMKSPINISNENDVSILKDLKDISTPCIIKQNNSNNKSISDYINRLNKLKLDENDIAKVTEARVTSVFCHPSSNKLIVAAGDKAGFLGLWDVDKTDVYNGGVYKYRPHVESIIRLHASNNEPSKIYSASYDGTIRYIDIEKDCFDLNYVIDESINDISLTDASFINDSSLVYIATNKGEISQIDLRINNNKHNWKYLISSSKINSIQHNPIDSHIVVSTTSGKDSTIYLHDTRKISSKVKYFNQLSSHSKSINASYFTPDGLNIVSVSQDNTIKVWSDYNNSNNKFISINHDNHTGRWLSTFRPAFDIKQANVFIIGSMNQPRKIDIFNISRDNNKVNPVNSLQSDNLNSVCSRNCTHNTLDIIVGGNSSGRLHVFR